MGDGPTRERNKEFDIHLLSVSCGTNRICDNVCWCAPPDTDAMLDVAPVEDHADLLRELGAGVEAGDEQGEESDEESVDSPLMEGEDFVLSAEQSSSASESRWWPGILAKNYAAWRRIGTPWVILSWIVFGFCLPFSGERPPEYYHANHPGAFEYAPHVTAAVLSMMAAGVCALVDSRPWICSPLNMIPKRLRENSDCYSIYVS